MNFCAVNQQSNQFGELRNPVCYFGGVRPGAYECIQQVVYQGILHHTLPLARTVAFEVLGAYLHAVGGVLQAYRCHLSQLLKCLQSTLRGGVEGAS